MKSAKNVEQSIKKLTVESGDRIHNRILDRLLTRLDKPKVQGTAEKANVWRRIMRSKVSKIAAAAVIITAIVVLHQFSKALNGTSIAWADVAERLEGVRSYKAQARRALTETGQEEPFFECDIVRYFSPKHGSVEESYEDGELVMQAYCSIAEKAILVLFPENKMCWRFDFNEELLSLVEYVNPANTEGIMKLFGSERCTKLGSREFDGVIAEGFEVKDVEIFSQLPEFLLHPEDINIRLWVNEETLLPIRIEGEGFVGKGVLTGFTEFTYREVMHNIEYDVEIDESVFDPNIPDDYILIDPANMAEKAELTMLGIVPCGAGMIIYKRVKKRRSGITCDR